MLEQSLKSYNATKIWYTVMSKQYAVHHLMVKLSTMFQPYLMTTVGGDIWKQSKVWKIFNKCNNYQNFVYNNLKTIRPLPPQGLNVHQISMGSKL